MPHDRLIFTLAHDTARRLATQAVHDAPDGYLVIVEPPKRNGEQNAMFHAICSNLAKSGHLWQGKRRTAAQWKNLLISAHVVATKEGSEIMPGLEGEFVNLRESTALMSKKRASSLIEYSVAYCVLNGIEVAR